MRILFILLFFFSIPLFSENGFNEEMEGNKNQSFTEGINGFEEMKPTKVGNSIDGTSLFGHREISYNMREFQEEELSSSPEENSPFFQMIFYGGLSYRVGKKHDNLLREDMAKFKSGYHGGAEIGFRFPKYFGLGMKFDLGNFQNLNSDDTYLRNMNIIFLGPVVSFRVNFLEDKLNVLGNASVGYISYWVDGSFTGQMIGNAIGSAYGVGGEYEILKNLYIGCKSSFMLGKALLGINPVNNKKVYEGLNRLDLTLTIKIIIE